MSDQQFSILIGHPDEAAMEAIGVGWVGDEINTQHFEVGLKEHLAGKEQGAGENFVYLEGLVECDTDATAADVDGSLDEGYLRCVVLSLKTDGQGDSNAIKLAAIFPSRLQSRGIRWHGVQEYTKEWRSETARVLVRAH
ncbi:MAG TPA: hypothetical protein VN666_06760 [Nitrospira sp.]|nr:hypothetical protein [Nitrospira sp.]